MNNEFTIHYKVNRALKDKTLPMLQKTQKYFTVAAQRSDHAWHDEACDQTGIKGPGMNPAHDT